MQPVLLRLHERLVLHMRRFHKLQDCSKQMLPYKNGWTCPSPSCSFDFPSYHEGFPYALEVKSQSLGHVQHLLQYYKPDCAIPYRGLSI